MKPGDLLSMLGCGLFLALACAGWLTPDDCAVRTAIYHPETCK